MHSLENRLMKLETAQQAIRRPYSDAERAVRLVYLLAQGGPVAGKVLALLNGVKGANVNS